MVMMKIRDVVIGFIVSAVVVGIAVSCGGGNSGSGSGYGGAPAMVIRSASLDGTQAGTGAAGIGRGAVVVNPATMGITGGITFTGLTGNPTAAHIHRANTTVAVGLTLASDNATGVLLNNITLSPADYAELLAGTLYFNVHTVANPGGEIRGQINVQGGVVAGTSPLDNMQEVPASTSPATGQGTVVVDATTGAVLIAYIAHTVSGANAAHIHTSPSGPGSNGAVILGFPNLQTNVDGAGTNLAYPTASPTPSLATNLGNFLANYLYFNVHSNVASNFCAPAVNCAAGEIRGNITALQ
jgi:hypothetical protein